MGNEGAGEGRRPPSLRRVVVRAAPAVAVLVAAGCWGQPGMNPLHQGYNALESQLTAANVATLAPAWTAAVDDGPVRAEPVVSSPAAVHTSDDLAAYALDTATGARRWRTQVVPAPAPTGASTGPVTVDGTSLFVPWDNVPDSGSTVRLDVATGQVQSQTGIIGPQSVTARSPWRVTTINGLIEGTLPGGGVSVDGPVPWFLLTHFGGTAPVVGPTAATVTSDRFYVGLHTGFYGADILGGWRLDRSCPPIGSAPPPAPCQPEVRAQLDGAPTTPVVADDEATVYTATDAGTVYAVDAATGAVRWTAAVGAPVTQRPALTPGRLYVVTDDGRLLRFAAGGCGAPTCTPIRTTTLAGPPATPPAVAGGVVYVASDGGVLAAYAASGPAPAALWSTEVGAEVTAGPTVAFGTLYAGTGDGRVVAFRPS